MNTVINPELIIFDLDGTLVDFPKDFLLTEAERIIPLTKYKVPSREKLEEYFSSFNFFGFANNDQEVVDIFWEKFDWESFPKSKPFDFTIDVLSQLKKLNIKMAIATARTSKEGELSEDLKQSGLSVSYTHLTLPTILLV